MTGARSCHRHRVAQNPAAKFRPVSEGLGEEVDLGSEWAESRFSGGVAFGLSGGRAEGHGLGKGKSRTLQVGASVEVRSRGGQVPALGPTESVGAGP